MHNHLELHFHQFLFSGLAEYQGNIFIFSLCAGLKESRSSEGGSDVTTKKDLQRCLCQNEQDLYGHVENG